MVNIIDYKKIMYYASLNAIQGILSDVSKNGLPGDHHFYITIDMTSEGVTASSSLKEKHPKEMTIVIQNWYEGLEVNDSFFLITLNFGNIRESLKIPFIAIKSFVDPSVEFGLSFENHFENKTNLNKQKKLDPSDTMDKDQVDENRCAPEKKSGDVVSLENFRKS